MSTIVPVIVIVIIGIQLLFFILNLLRMYEFRDIFKHESSWCIEKNEDTGFVCGINGSGNKIFTSIELSINKYLGNNSGSVIDFHLLKDAADRHCDSVENDISTQTPIPLYCGLAGTMAGVILGLVPLILSGTLIYLLGGELPEGIAKVEMDNLAASGINELLAGVAWAMAASICGIVLTTINSLLFKSCKLKEESGKSSFLAWMQSCLLPELPSNTSDALNKLVRNLNNFNNTFASNTDELKTTLIKVNDAYKIQADVIRTVHDMDVMKMAKANVKVLEELQQCTDKLEVFNSYLDNIHGYTNAIQTFTTLFQQESNRLHVLEEIQQFFVRHKAEIAKDTADVDVALKEALATMKDSSISNVEELNKQLIAQSEVFKQILNEEKESFEKINEEISGQFNLYISDNIALFENFNKEIKLQLDVQMQQIPMLIKGLEPMKDIPERLERLFDKMEQSNNSFASKMLQAVVDRPSQSYSSVNDRRGADSEYNKYLPSWINWTIVISVVIIALACVTNTVYNMIPKVNTRMELSNNAMEIVPKKENIQVVDSAMTKKSRIEVEKDTIDNTKHTHSESKQ